MVLYGRSFKNFLSTRWLLQFQTPDPFESDVICPGQPRCTTSNPCNFLESSLKDVVDDDDDDNEDDDDNNNN